MQSSTTKHRDMARSILPSRARSIPVQLARARRAGRRGIARDLASLVRHGRSDGWDEWDEGCDLRRYPDIEIRRIVRWRRGADKLNHFERWAIAVTKALPPDDRLGHLRALLPGGLIGDHAMSHLRSRPELNPRHQDRHLAAAAYREALAAGNWAEADRVRALVVTLLEVPGGHKALNAGVKAGAPEGVRPRTLAGVHDVDAFLAPYLFEQYGRLVDRRGLDAIEAIARALAGPHD